MSKEPQPASIDFYNKNIWQFFFLMLFIQIAIVLLDGFVNYARFTNISQIRRMFNIAREDGIGTWYSSIQFFIGGLILWIIYLKTKVTSSSKWRVFGWLLLCFFFIFLSIDDSSEIHERLGSVFKILVKDKGSFLSSILDAYPSYAWQVAVGPFFIAAGLFIFGFLWSEFKGLSLRKWFILGLSCYAIAIGLDYVEGIDGGHRSIERYFRATNYTVRHFAKSLEEFIEMTGTAFFLVAFLKYLFVTTSELSVNFKEKL